MALREVSGSVTGRPGTFSAMLECYFNAGVTGQMHAWVNPNYPFLPSSLAGLHSDLALSS